MKTLKMPSGYLVVLTDSEVSVSTTEKGKELFKGKSATFYKAGIFEVNIPYETLMEVANEANRHIKEYEESIR